MACSVLSKPKLTTSVPADPGNPGSPGTPYHPAYCTTTEVSSCKWVPNPEITYQYECWQEVGPYFSAGKLLNGPHQVCGTRTYYNGILVSDIVASNGGATNFPAMIWSCSAESVETCYPEQAAVPGIPPSPPTEAQTIINDNLGWGASSRSATSIPNGAKIDITLEGVAAYIGVAPNGYDNAGLDDYYLGFLLTGNEGGVSNVMVRRFNNYYNIENNGNIISQLLMGTDPSDLYIYVKLYSGGDRVSVCTTGEDCYDIEGILTSIVLSGTGSILLAAPIVDGVISETITFAGFGSLDLADRQARFLGAGRLFAFSSGGNAVGQLPVIESLAGDYEYSIGLGYLPGIDTSSEGGFFIPSGTHDSFGWLPFMTAFSIGTTDNPGDGDAELPPLLSLSGDYEFGFASSILPALINYAQDEDRLAMRMLSYSFMLDDVSPSYTGLLVLMSEGDLQSVQEMDILALMELLSAMSASSQWTVLGEFGFQLMSQSTLSALQVMKGVDGAALNDLTRVWVVNMETGASTQYDGYGFNGYFIRDGEAYGTADDGIYLLQGDADDGLAIDSTVSIGVSKIGSVGEKKIPHVYVSSSGEKLILKLQADDGDPYYYEMRSRSDRMDKHRFDPGLGLKGVEWDCELANQAGGDFDVSSLEFMAVEMNRRI